MCGMHMSESVSVTIIWSSTRSFVRGQTCRKRGGSAWLGAVVGVSGSSRSCVGSFVGWCSLVVFLATSLRSLWSLFAQTFGFALRFPLSASLPEPHFTLRLRLSTSLRSP